jgi:hypothetical protein
VRVDETTAHYPNYQSHLGHNNLTQQGLQTPPPPRLNYLSPVLVNDKPLSYNGLPSCGDPLKTHCLNPGGGRTCHNCNGAPARGHLNYPRTLARPLEGRYAARELVQTEKGTSPARSRPAPSLYPWNPQPDVGCTQKQMLKLHKCDDMQNKQCAEQ